ncbi:hypothetical protein HNR42_001335 [Deinobacterium chartae]|uniref:Uncharacterized protein n=1 Tax=Deinobacterium chartae TaxID=521158 RepID=A0A841I1G8_9DEIO|nr:hypothetical protein [Deinobacterium chartae]MBB6097912.1 hypothetical protein [Deinobacterium chartae]
MAALGATLLAWWRADQAHVELEETSRKAIRAEEPIVTTLEGGA